MQIDRKKSFLGHSHFALQSAEVLLLLCFLGRGSFSSNSTSMMHQINFWNLLVHRKNWNRICLIRSTKTTFDLYVSAKEISFTRSQLKAKYLITYSTVEFDLRNNFVARVKKIFRFVCTCVEKTSCEALIFWHFVVNFDWLFTSKLQIILTDTPTLIEVW